MSDFQTTLTKVDHHERMNIQFAMTVRGLKHEFVLMIGKLNNKRSKLGSSKYALGQKSEKTCSLVR